MFDSPHARKNELMDEATITDAKGTVYPEKDYCIIELIAEQVKGETKDGKKYDFLSYHTFDKKAKRAKIKFTKKANNIPTESGTYEAVIKREDMNRDKQSRYYEIWVKDIVSLHDYVPKFEKEYLDF